MSKLRLPRSLRSLLLTVVRDLWSSLVFYGLLSALGDPDACTQVVLWQWKLDEPPPGHPERLSRRPLTALERELAGELTGANWGPNEIQGD